MVDILDYQTEGESEGKLHIAIAPTKSSDRFEFFLEKATEIGISEITPILTKNSERKKLNIVRCQKIVESAMKQSQRLFLPKLNDLTPLSAFLQQSNSSHLKLIAHCEEDDKTELKDLVLKGKDVCILIGPEGDFNPNEIEDALAIDFKPVSLGEKRLRTETAGIYVCLGYQFGVD